ncbi:MAG: right-handed parallel beta-helix repeat-containing protein [Cyanobacteria bacterium P01_A01_bin.123]
MDHLRLRRTVQCANSIALGFFFAPAIALANPSPDIGAPVSQPISQSNPTHPLHSSRYRVNYQNSGSGYTGYGSLEGLFPLMQTPDGALSFIEGRVLLDNDASLGGNVVFGHRVFDPANQYWLGGYVAVDIRNANSGNTFYQLGLGAELLGDGWDAHANVYLPVGDNSRLNGTPQFQGNALLVPIQAAMTGADIGVGAELLRFENGGGLRASGDLYVYTAHNIADTIGGRVELTLQPAPYLTTGLGLQHDSLFGTSVLFQVGIDLNPHSPASQDSPATVWARGNESVHRQGAIVLVEQTQVATDPATGNAYVFRHVDPHTGSAIGSNGAVETPRNTVANTVGIANSGDIVYVQTGHAGGGFTIPDGVQVLSVGPVQTVDTQFGRVQLPDSGVGTLPQLAGTVTMGNQTRLSGFEIAASAGSGIEANNVTDVAIQFNQITSAQNFGVFVGADTGGTSGNIVIEHNTIENVTNYDGIFVGASAGSTLSDVTIQNNEINTVGRDGIGIGAHGNSELTQAIVTQNQITATGRFGIGIGVDTLSAPNLLTPGSGSTVANAVITHNTITSAGTAATPPAASIGVATQSDSSQVCFELSGNTSAMPPSLGVPFSNDLDLYLLNRFDATTAIPGNFQIVGRSNLDTLNTNTFDVINMFSNAAALPDATLDDTNSTSVSSCS